MPDAVKGDIDLRSVFAGLEKLPDVVTHVARSMGVAGGKVYRDAAKALAPVGTAEGGSATPGRLQSAIYLAYRDGESTATHVVYSVTWNHKHAPHGHLLEFGHLMPYKSYTGKDGQWYSTKTLRATPKWIAARPFLRPAYDASGPTAARAMLARGMARVAELMGSNSNVSDG